MAAFPLPAGHPFASVRPGYAGFESTPDGSVINATASYVGASGDYPANAITLQLFATQGGTWAVGTPAGLTVQTSPTVNQAYTTAVYNGGLRGQTYTFTSISLTPAQGATLGWLGTAPSVTLTIPTNTTTIASGYYEGGNAGGIYLTPVLDSTLTPIVQGITNYFFVCTTSAAYASVDSIGTAIIPFPTGTTFTAGTTTSLDFTVQCRSNGILGQPSPLFTVGIVQPAVPSLTGVLSVNNVNLTFSSTTPGCTFDLSYSGAVTATGITSPYSYTTTTPGAYTFQVRASLRGLTTFSLPSTTTIFPAQPAGVTSTVSGLSISLAWTSPVGTGYTYNVSGTGLATQTVLVPNVQYTNLPVGLPTFYIQSVYAGIRSTTCNVQVSIPTTTPYNFRGSAVGATITLSWANDTPGATFTLSSSSPTTVATQNSLTTPSYTYTNVPGGSYSFTVVSTSAGIPSSPATVAGLVALSAPTNFAITTLESTANLTWQNATPGVSFNISYVVTSTLSSKAVVAGATTTSIFSLLAGNYTFGIQSLLTGASSSFVTAAATIVAAPTSFTATSRGTTISLSWFESTPNCSFTITQPTLGTKTTTNSNVQYTGATAGSSYTFTLTPCNTAAFVGPSVTTTGTVLSTPTPSAVLSGTNVNVSWAAVTGTSMTYTVSSSPGVPNPPTQPGSLLSVSFVSPPPAAYTFSVIAFDSSGNASVAGTTALLTVPVPQPTNVGAKMSASSQMTVTWTETLPGCTFTFTGAPATTAASVTNIGTEYTGVFNNPSPGGYTIAVVAASGGISSIASVGVAVYTFQPFNVSLSAACSQSGTTNNVTAAYSMSSPAAIYGAGTNGTSPYVANVGYSGTTLTPPITSGTAGLGGNYGSGFYGNGNTIINAVPATFPVNFVVPPTSLTVTANGTNLLVKWADSTTAGCRYTVSGTPGTFTCNVADGSGSTGITFTNATIGTAYTFIITASSAGTYTASREYYSGVAGLVTTENATIPYTITSVSVPSTAVTPINFPATFTATATGTTIAINWSTVTGATGYTVFDGGSSLFTTTTATTCNYTGTAGQTYTLTVRANAASVSNTNPTAITVTPVATPVITSIAQSGSNITVTSTGTGLSINTPAGLSAPTGTSTFTFTGGSGNTAYSFTVTATGTNATSSATSAFTTLGTPAITSATAQGTATITVNWTYTGPNVSGFTVYSNSINTASVGPAVRSAIFAQSATTNNADTVYVVANGTVGSSIESASVNVADLASPPTLTSSTVNALSFTVQWTYPTTARALSTFQVCNSTLTTLYSTVPYVANQLNYNSLFNVPSIAAYSFVIVGRDSVGSTISSAASASVTPVAAPTIGFPLQTGSVIRIAATGTGVSTPTVSPTLTTVSTVTPWDFTGATGNTLYTFTVQANGPGASNTRTCNVTTLATPDIPTVSASGTTVTVNMPSYSGSPSFSVSANPQPLNRWTQTSAPQSGWVSIASSSDGTKLAAVISNHATVRGIWINASSGVGTWTQTSAPTTLVWSSIATDSSGTKLVAAAPNAGIWRNVNSGLGTWTETSAPTRLLWTSIASSSDGTKLAVTTANTSLCGGIWINASSGVGTWTQTSAPKLVWRSIASSSDGTKLAATTDYSGIWTNASSGVGTWTQTSATAALNWRSIASSSDGTKLAAGTTNLGLWTNANSGAGTWTERTVGLPRPADWEPIVSSANGAILTAGVYGGGIYTSTDSGGTWTRMIEGLPASANWYSIATDSSGTKLAAVASGGGIYTYSTDYLTRVQTASTIFTASVGITYSVGVVAIIGLSSSIASPSPLTSPLSAASGCILWLDGADPNNTGSPVANGTTITTWKDKSGNANDATSGSGSITVTGNSLVFDGTSKYLTVPGIAGKIVNTPFVIFIVETFGTGSTSSSLYFGDDNVNSTTLAGWSLHTGYRSKDTQTFAFYGSDLDDSSIIPQTGETRIWALYLPTTANRNTRRNGNVDVTFGNNTRLQAFTAPRIGRCFGGGYFNGTIAEILVFPSDIGIPAIQRIEQYLANKWKVSSVSGIVTPLATPTATASVNGGTITVTCGTPTAGTVLNIPTTPTGLTRSSYTTNTFTYTGATGGTAYSFSVFAYNGPATSSAGSTSVTPLFTPGKPTVTVNGTTVNIAWTYGPSTTTPTTGITFNVKDNNNNWTGTTVTNQTTASFTGVAQTSYSIYVYATSGTNQSANSTSADSITVLGIPTLTQNYLSTTQTKIVGTATAGSATSYSGTTDSSGLLSAATATGGTLTWTGATGGRVYTGISINAAAGASTRSVTNQTLQSAFDPTTIPGCRLWLDAADPDATGTPPANGATISLWKDKSGLGSNATATGGPTISSTGLNGNPTMNFNGSSWFDGSTTNTGTTTTIFMVMQQPAQTTTINPNYTRVLSMAPLGGNDDNNSGIYTKGLLIEFINGGLLAWRGDVTYSTQPVATPYIFDYLIDGTNAFSYINGTSQGSFASSGNFSIGKYRIGGIVQYNGTPQYTGYISEVLVFNTALTTTQRQAIEGYLGWKWGLQGSLSSTNPYSTLASPAATAPPLAITAPTSVNYLVVGGGGGGGSRFGGGGGAGGFLEGQSFAVAKGTAYTVTVGAGGAGGIGTGTAGSGGGQNTAGAQPGTNGTSSVFSTITATGGGGGAAGDGGNGLSGASGGGGAGRANSATSYNFSTTGGTGTAGQGTNGMGSISGTYIGGGGGGAGASPTSTASTTGGAGTTSSITGTSVTYAGGGGGGGSADTKYGVGGDGQNGSPGGVGGGGAGGGWSGTTIPATAGTANTGGGGGGGAYNFSYSNSNQPGAAGGSGVVILSYPSTFNTITSITGTLVPTTPSIVGTNIVYRFTSGTGTITW